VETQSERALFRLPASATPFFRGYHIVCCGAGLLRCNQKSPAKLIARGPRISMKKNTRAALGRTASGADGTCPPTAKKFVVIRFAKLDPVALLGSLKLAD